MMDERVRALAHELLESGVEHLSERERKIIARIAHRHHISRNVSADYDDRRTLGEVWADRLALWGGSWLFVLAFGLFLLGSGGANMSLLPQGWRFDPYPFVFLNLILSMLAAIQAPVILMSQNRQAAKDRLQATQDYEVNLKAELEIMALHDKMDRLAETVQAAVLRR